MAVFCCGIKDCSFSTTVLELFFIHHNNHPENDRNKYVCSFEGCFKDCGNRKNFRAHLKMHLRKETGDGEENGNKFHKST